MEAPVTAVFAADLKPINNLPHILDIEAKAGKSTRYLHALSSDMSIFLGGTSCMHDTMARTTSIASRFVPGAFPTFNSAEGWAFKSTALAAMTYMYAATAAGLATHPMEGFDARGVRSACRIPDRYAIPMLVATGYPLQSEAANGNHRRPSPRLPMGQMFKLDSFAQPLGFDNGE